MLVGPLDLGPVYLNYVDVAHGWGRTGFDLEEAPEAACRGRCVGLVKHRIKTLVANEELALAA